MINLLHFIILSTQLLSLARFFSLYCYTTSFMQFTAVAIYAFPSVKASISSKKSKLRHIRHLYHFYPFHYLSSATSFRGEGLFVGVIGIGSVICRRSMMGAVSADLGIFLDASCDTSDMLLLQILTFNVAFSLSNVSRKSSILSAGFWESLSEGISNTQVVPGTNGLESVALISTAATLHAWSDNHK